MLKGISDPETMIAVLVFAAAIGFIFIFIRAQVSVAGVELANIKEDIQVIDLAHQVKACLGSPVQATFLEANKDLAKICGLSSSASVSIRNIETGKEWAFGSGGQHKHSIYVPIEEEGKTYAGVIDVRI